MTYYESRLLDVLGNIAVVESCWEWLGACDTGGYGVTSLHNKTSLVHRFVYAQHKGAIPPHMQIDHLCRNRRCCNPDHLEPVSPVENTMRSKSVTAANASKTHCIHGHPLYGDNLYLCWHSDGRLKQRRCKACERSYARRKRATL